MALLVPDCGEAVMLKALLNHTAPQDLTLKLYATNVTPGESDTAGSYTEAAGGGYAAKTLTGASWTVTPGAPSSAAYAAQVFTFTGALTTNPVVYGYFVVQATSGILMWAELFGTPFTPANNGDSITITPQITLA